jgi:transglutaminase-like putative cysteine protease
MRRYAGIAVRRYAAIAVVTLAMVCPALAGYAQDAVTAAIADSLRQGASVVERVNVTEIEIESARKAKIHRRVVYTILNAAGDGYATLHTFYDKFHDLISATGVLYDGNGKVVRKIRKSDMEDWSTAGSGILMTDSRVKLYHFSSLSYPYSVSYEEEVEQTGLFMLPGWRPQASPSMAVESSSFSVRAPTGYPLRYKLYGYAQSSVSEKGGSKILSWALRNRPAVRPEPYSRLWAGVEPCVLLAPGDFEEDGYKGRLYSWADMGKFVEELYRGRDQLPEEAKKKVHALVDGVTDDRKKIESLYRWLQQDTHYVAIELGIGGWQPYAARDVYIRKYGDCKALSNYMVALLKEAGIRACNVLIRAGQDAPEMDTGFVCSQFNHAIVVAFTGSDSVWLECTNSYLPAGYLSGFTADRGALLLDEQGGHIVRTPVYGADQNQLNRVVHGRIDSSGNLVADIQTRYSGLEQDGLESELSSLSKEEVKKRRQETIGLPNCTINQMRLAEIPSADPVIDESLEVTSEGYSMVSGNRLFITPGAFLRRAEGIKEGMLPRKNDVQLLVSSEETDSIFLAIPRGYVPESTLPSANYSSSFGSYRIRGELKGNTLLLVCRYRQYKGSYPADSWTKLEHFFNLIHREGNRELVFIKH